MKIKRGYIESFIRFVEPVRYCKIYAFKHLMKGLANGANPFIHVLFIQNLVKFLENGSTEGFNATVVSYILYIAIYEFIQLITYKWGWYALDPEIRKILGNKYIEKYIKLDNTTTEKTGTGKSISIIDKGIDTWAYGITMLFWNGSGLIASFLIALYYLGSVNVIGAVFFVIIFLGALFSYILIQNAQ